MNSFGGSAGGVNDSGGFQRNRSDRHHGSEESAFNTLRDVIQQLTNHKPETDCNTLEEALRLIKTLPTENERMRQQLGIAGRSSGGQVYPINDMYYQYSGSGQQRYEGARPPSKRKPS